MRNLLTIVCVAIVCITASSCVTTQTTETTYHPVHCVVEPETEVVFEIQLYGKLILSGKSAPQQLNTHHFAASFGDHVLTVTAPGYQMWKRTITVIGGPTKSQGFWAKLTKESEPKHAR